MPSPPSGDITFVFTDVEGSTTLWDRHPEAMAEALAEHDRRIRDIVAARDGYVFTTAGDSFAVAFSSARAALDAAVGIQLAMREPAGGLHLGVRIGVHTGTATLRGGDYFGGAVNRCARVAASAHGGQIVVTGTFLDHLGVDHPGGVDVDGVELLDLGVHRLRGLDEPEHLSQVCHPELEREHPRLRTVQGPEDALPAQLTSFVGRRREVAEVIELLGGHRMLTLSGAGGAGKTRLAIRVGEESVARFPDGLRFAELAAVHDPDLLVEEVAQRFSVGRVPDQSLTDTLTAAIGHQRVLLVLDNCEQIVDAAAALCRELLERCPNLHLLITSRHRLGVRGELVYRVPSLTSPALGAGVVEAMGCDSVRLFVDRARLAQPHFEVMDGNVGEVVAICRHLDGIPLALELAAARLRSLSPGQIVRRLDERFRLLTGSDQAPIARQETLLATIEWSYDLLGEMERSLFRRLGVFAADFALEAAEQICAGGELDVLDVIEVLTSLVDKSMVTTEQGGDGATRYQLLETIREFARHRTQSSDELERIREAHAAYFAAEAESLQAMQRSGDLQTALLRLAEDESEFRVALGFTLDSHRSELAGRLIDGLGYLWYAAGTHREGLDWCTQLFDGSHDLPDPIRAGALHSYALLLGVSGRTRQGIEVLEEQVRIRRRLGDPARLAAALNNLGNLLGDVGDVDAAEPALVEAIELTRLAGRSPTLMLSSLAWCRRHAGRYDEAEAGYLDSIREARLADDAYAVAVAMAGLGMALTEAGRGEDARPRLVEAGERFAELKVLPGLVDVELWLGVVERGAGHDVEASRRFSAALAGAADHWYDDAAYWIMQFAASTIDDLATAALLLGTAAAAYERTDVAPSVFIADDLEATRRRLEVELGEAEFGIQFRAGGRRTRAEATAIAETALQKHLETAPPT